MLKNMDRILDLGCAKGCPILSRNKADGHLGDLSARLDCHRLRDLVMAPSQPLHHTVPQTVASAFFGEMHL